MSAGVELYVKVCEKCGRQVHPRVDHNLGTSRTVYCAHGKPRPLELVTWERIRVVPVPAKVYVVECGVYAERYLHGTYLDLEEAKAEHKTGPDGWSERDGTWDNGLDMQSAVTIYTNEVGP